MAVNKTELKNELNTDPLAKGYKAGPNLKPPIALEKIINNRAHKQSVRPVEKIAMLKWLASQNVRAKIEDDSTNKPSATRSASLVLLDILRRGDSNYFQANDTTVQTLIGRLVTGGTFNAADKTSYDALVTQPCSRAEELWGVGTYVSYVEIEEALR